MTAMPNVIAFRPRPVRSGLRRPAVLIRAAREGQAGWRRDRDLPRLLHSDRCPAPGAALPRLRAEEAMLNDARTERAADYDMRRHVLLMIAILAEMRAAVAAAPQPVPEAGAVAGAAERIARAAGSALSGLGTAIPAHP
ncbi:DUF6477 family protein [Paracoccus spongiarum]|uniref:DUF6477 family protein n=1 Tax=Paracoccus spongiarum TaxID=3064387 RepID=A0ABT9JE57_9RHOB|nr:DUF6477 family protein [Paracoccus sp. 2205BS29-5]MDP5308109.1 DUF6477 family protein [Paracoccus sp. 2205BS29-5]